MRKRKARQPTTRPGLIAAVIIIWVLIAACALTGTLIAAFSQEHPATFSSPLLIYPVTQQTAGVCPAGVPGVVGQGPTCYQVTTGITIRKVADLHVEKVKRNEYGVSMSLHGADGKALARLTRGAAGRVFALTVRNQVIAAPRVDAPITKGRILITGGLTKATADTMVKTLSGKSAQATA